MDGQLELDPIVLQRDQLLDPSGEGPGRTEVAGQQRSPAAGLFHGPRSIAHRAVHGVGACIDRQLVLDPLEREATLARPSGPGGHDERAVVALVLGVVGGRQEQVDLADPQRFESPTSDGVDRGGRIPGLQLDHRMTLSRPNVGWKRVPWHPFLPGVRDDPSVRAVVQRVSEARVTVDGDVVGSIRTGLCVLVGVTHEDGEGEARALADKIWHLRVMDDADGVMNRSVADTTGEILVVSQFTLYGDTSRGRRPSWIAAARPEQAEPLVDAVVARLRDLGGQVATGRFRADMQVALVNDGPVTILLEI